MYEVTYYYSFDDVEFNNKEACLAYEEKVLKTLKGIHEAYSFFTCDMDIFNTPFCNKIENWIDWIRTACKDCEFIRRKRNLTKEEEKILDDVAGYCILNKDFNNESGLFKWNNVTIEWDKVGK